MVGGSIQCGLKSFLVVSNLLIVQKCGDQTLVMVMVAFASKGWSVCDRLKRTDCIGKGKISEAQSDKSAGLRLSPP